MKNAPKNGMMKLVVQRRGPNGLRNLRPIRGFSGCYLAISSKPFRWSVDNVHLESEDNIVVISTSNGDGFRLSKPWRKKYNGKPYGAKWVALMADTGRKKYFKLEDLAQKVFGERWDEVKQQIEAEASKDILGELF